MARYKSPVAKKPLTITLEERLLEQLRNHLYIAAVDRIPVGAYQQFITARLKEFFDNEHLDLAPYIRQPEGTFIVSGHPETVKLLKDFIEGRVDDVNLPSGNRIWDHYPQRD